MSALLNLHGVHAFYGAAHILHGLDLHVNAGERVALLGRNGVGKTTVVNTILGLAQLRAGSIQLGGVTITKPRPYIAAQHGIAVVPQGRRIVANLTVEENLHLGAAVGRKGPWNVPEIYKLFPILQERAHTPGTALSGGQQQRVAVGRALMANPRLILLAEPTEGLAPQVVLLLGQLLTKLRARGMAVLLIEQKLSLALEVSDRCYVMGHGRVVFEGTPEQLLQADAIRREWLEV